MWAKRGMSAVGFRIASAVNNGDATLFSARSSGQSSCHRNSSHHCNGHVRQPPSIPSIQLTPATALVRVNKYVDGADVAKHHKSDDDDSGRSPGHVNSHKPHGPAARLAVLAGFNT